MELDERITGVAALADPVRRQVYLYVAAQDDPVSRDDVAAGVGVARHTAKFHLDRLVADGLLDVAFRRLTGRSGPGAGRPSKVYRRAPHDVAVSLPERHYDLAGELMAVAIDRSAADGTPVLDALHAAAEARGTEVARRRRTSTSAAAAATPTTATAATTATTSIQDAPDPLTSVCAAVAELGYEPRQAPSEVVLANCPFHALAREHTALVCGMNLALLRGLAHELGGVQAHLRPAEGRCCVVLTGED